MDPHNFKKQDILLDPRKCNLCGRPYEWAPKPKTFGWFEALAIAGVFVLIGGVLQKWESDHHRYSFENIKVLKKYDAYRYKLRFASGDYAVYFCKNYRPCLPEGAVLTSLRYEDDGDCWDIAPMGLGYNFLMDERGNDIDETGKIVFDAVKDSCN